MSAYSSITGALKLLYYNSINSAKTRKSRGHIEKGEHNITLEYLNELWKIQEEKCYYSNIPMNFDKHEWRVSIERTDPSKGYIIDNIALCCLEFNTRTQWSHPKIDEMLDILNKNIDKYEVDFNPHGKQKKKYGKVVKYENNMYKCSKCDKIKPISDFPSKISEGCKQCVSDYAKMIAQTPRGALQKLLTSSKNATNIRNSKNRDMDHDIDLEFLIELYNNQDGLCAYSGIPLQFGSYLNKSWTISLERIDTLKGYIKDNVCLICLEFNSSDHTTITGSDYGSAGWSFLKFQYFIAHVKHKKGLISNEELETVKSVQKIYTSRQFERISYNQQRKEYIHIVSHFTEAKRNYGHIFMLTAPSGKRFIGKSLIVFQEKKAVIHKIIRRQGYALILKEIDKHGEDNIVYEKLVSCKKEQLDFYEEYFKQEYNTYVPNGFNKPIRMKPEVRQQIKETLVKKNERLDHKGQPLPLYMCFTNWKDRKGYSIKAHPKCKLKFFGSTVDYDLDEYYERCLEFLIGLG